MHQLRTKLTQAGMRDMLHNASSMIGTTVITSGLGFAYWWVAARMFAQAQVGFASALIAAMGLLSTFGIVGLGTLLMSELPRQPGEHGSLITVSLSVASLCSLLLAGLFILIGPELAPEFQVLRDQPMAGLLFSFGVVVNTAGLLIDQALIGMLRASAQFWRNATFAVVKLLLLLLLGLLIMQRDSIAIYTTWTAGAVLSLLMLMVLPATRKALRPARPHWGVLRSLPGAALVHHSLNLALQIPGLAMPVVVTTLLSAELNASFYMAWLNLHLVFAIPYALTMVLYAMGASDPAAFADKARWTIRVALILGALSNLVIWPGAGLLLGLFGERYAIEAAWPLRIMALGVFPLIIKDHYVAVSRVHGRIRSAAGIAMLGSILEIGLAAVGALLNGLQGIAIGFVIALICEALIMVRSVYQAISIREPDSSALGLHSATSSDWSVKS